MLITLAILFIPLLFIGMPIGFAMGFSGLVALTTGSSVSLGTMIQQIIGDLNSFGLMACPFFLLAGELMSGGGLTEKIIGFCSSLIGWVKGGMAITAVGACMIFAGISGSGAADTSAIGTLIIPSMRERGYDDAFSASLLAGAGALGPIIPPSMNMIVYAGITGDSVAKLFMGGIIPGVLMGLLMVAYSIYYTRKAKIEDVIPFSAARLWREFKGAVWALICPGIILGGIIFGIFTATEAGIVACVYALFCGTCIYKQLNWNRLVENLYNTVKTNGMVMFVLSTSAVLAYIFARTQAGNYILAFAENSGLSNEMFMVLILLVVLFLGMFMDMLAGMMVLMPLLYPVITTMGIHPIQFGVLFSIATVIGAITPPVGTYIFISMGIAGTTMKKMLPHLIPMIIITSAVTAAIIFIPELATFIPTTFG